MPTKALPGRLSPEWVDEEEETDIPSCPSLPDPIFPRDPQFDVVAIKLPCTRVAGVVKRCCTVAFAVISGKIGGGQVERQ
jgi:hypothetical protein